MQSATEDNTHYGMMEVGRDIEVVNNPDQLEQSTIPGSMDRTDAASGVYASVALVLLGIALPFIVYRGAKAAI